MLSLGNNKYKLFCPWLEFPRILQPLCNFWVMPVRQQEVEARFTVQDIIDERETNRKITVTLRQK